ncbi:MAG: hypothetical protein Edafosvirus2_29 [Edafosvirus sp.]|uniref:PPM-type phosphatase domain-containing protein n=1 Tax=Edafosvirus sp. TaxID=2487765 RepID=A0A3G4ZSH1_9VIRU|nr:MAG: hypothetical protein Edafosvirus2_29 [Edafosvirus sp.]
MTSEIKKPIRRPVSAFSEMGSREKNDDAIVYEEEFEDGQLSAVFDGHFQTYLQTVSQCCSLNLKSILTQFKDLPWLERLEKTVEELNRKVVTSTTGTTAVIVFVTNDGTYHIANIGDCVAMIVNAHGECMDINDGHVTYKDCFEPEFKKNGIAFEYKMTKYITRPHVHTIDDIYNPEITYYKTVKNLSVIKGNGTGQLCVQQSPLVGLEPLRAIGDTHLPELIRVPELYTWKLTPEQAREAKLVVMSDGFLNQKVFSNEKVAKLVTNPISALTNMDFLLRQRTLFETRCITEKDIITFQSKLSGIEPMSPEIFDILLKIFEEIIPKFCTTIKKFDAQWSHGIKVYFEKFKTKIASLKEKADYNDLLELIILMTVMFGCDDNISLIVLDAKP